jgi:3-deoxy-D-manno-octulosonate 8-phosphate phosphatase (KDO 8-P phosphatase)
MNVTDLCRRVELILSDVDGVLTDGGIWYDNQGVELKGFHIRDGLGIRLWQQAGFKFGVLTARTSHIVKLRAAELSIDIVRQGFEDKLPVAQEILRECGLAPQQVCYIGDDLTDLPVIRSIGFGVAVADAAAEVRAAAAYVTRLAGGRGAAREVIETILKAKGRWDDVIQRYGAK